MLFPQDAQPHVLRLDIPVSDPSGIVEIPDCADEVVTEALEIGEIERPFLSKVSRHCFLAGLFHREA
jgi:hypothetical protein